jgi:outer membrane protein assembly factor BamB
MIAGCDGYVRSIDLKTGRVRAKAHLDTNFSVAPAYRSGTVFVGALDGEYLAMRVSDGKVLWTHKEQTTDGIYANPAVQGGAVIFASRSSNVFRVDANTGAVRWKFRARSEVESSPVISGSVLFVGSDGGDLYALDLANGTKLWQFKAGAEIKTSPAIAHDRMIIGTGDGAVYCFGK